jgi:hypothetical protein
MGLVTANFLPLWSDAIRVPDNTCITLGNSEDLQIYHDGSNSYINETGTGNLILKGGNRVNILDDAGETMARFLKGGNSELYYDGSKKFETTNTGVTVTGNISACGGLSATKGVGYFACKVGIGTCRPETSLDIYSSVDQQTFCIQGC